MDARELQKTFASQAKDIGTKVLIRKAFDVLKFPQKLRGLYYTELERSPGIDATDAFRVAYPNFPVVIKIGSPTLSKQLSRLDRFWGTEGRQLIVSFERLMAEAAERTDEMPLMQLYKLPYIKYPMVLHNMEVPRFRGICLTWEMEDGTPIALQSLEDAVASANQAFERYIAEAAGDPLLA